MRGRVLSIGVKDYKFEDAQGRKISVPKNKITKVTFSRGKPEMGYESFFTRALVSVGSSEYDLSFAVRGISGSSPKESSYLSSRLGLEAGWQVIDYQLALHGGLEHTYLLPIEDTDTKFSYTSLTLGASYYLSFEKLFGGILKVLSPLYISPQVRLPLQASFQTKYSFGGQEAIVEPSLEGDGIGFGFSNSATGMVCRKSPALWSGIYCGTRGSYIGPSTTA